VSESERLQYEKCASSTGWQDLSLNSVTDYTSVGSGTSDVPVSMAVSGLMPFTNYECRLTQSRWLGHQQWELDSIQDARQLADSPAGPGLRHSGGAAFDINVLENDRGDGLTITGLAHGFPQQVALSSMGPSSTSHLVRSVASPESAPEIFGYQVSDTAQNQAEAPVTV
jgi:hypothetical protein